MTDYERANADVAGVVGGEVVSTGGGYLAVRFTVDGGYALLALDIDTDGPEEPWLVWREDADGERCCDWNAEEIGVVAAPADGEEAVDAYGTIREAALQALLAHRCHRWPEAPAPGHCDSAFCQPR